MRATRASVTIVPVSLDFAVFVFSVFTEFQVLKNVRSYTLEVSVYKTFLRCGVGCVELMN